MTPPKPRPREQVPEELLAAFREMCKRNRWSQVEVMSYILEQAIEQNTDLAIPLHVRRARRKTGEKWVNPYSES